MGRSNGSKEQHGRCLNAQHGKSNLLNGSSNNRLLEDFPQKKTTFSPNPEGLQHQPDGGPYPLNPAGLVPTNPVSSFCFSSPGKNINISSSDRSPLKPRRDNKTNSSPNGRYQTKSRAQHLERDWGHYFHCFWGFSKSENVVVSL